MIDRAGELRDMVRAASMVLVAASLVLVACARERRPIEGPPAAFVEAPAAGEPPTVPASLRAYKNA